MIDRIYKYVGPRVIREKAAGQPAGAEVRTITDVMRWMDACATEHDFVAATFVVMPGDRLLLADRHSEHVACAGGGDVLAAGEIFFSPSGNSITVSEVSNQSTGYCPDVDSWRVVERVLERLGLEHPGGFTTACIFRRCTGCGERNIVKDAWFRCAVCGKELEAEWNLG